VYTRREWESTLHQLLIPYESGEGGRGDQRREITAVAKKVNGEG